MIIDVFIPAIVVLLMFLVGTGLQLAQLKAMLRSPRLVIAGMLAQILLLPAGALLIIFLVRPEPELAAGLLLVAACPGGALSNTYCYLGGLNVALSVMLTAVSTMLSQEKIPQQKNSCAGRPKWPRKMPMYTTVCRCPEFSRPA